MRAPAPDRRLSRARTGKVTEIAARHLAFNPAEIRAVLGDGVAEQDLAAIAGVTQGRPALVRLAGELYCDGDAADGAEVAKGAHAVLFEYVD